METICLQCGNKGFENAFVYCIKCLDCAVHRYCLPVIPETFDEFVPWLCEDCEVRPLNQSIAHEQKENDAVAATTKEGLYEDGQLVQYDNHAELDLVKGDEFVPRLCEECEVGPANQSIAHEQKENYVVSAKAKDGLYENGQLVQYDTQAKLDLVKCGGFVPRLSEDCEVRPQNQSTPHEQKENDVVAAKPRAGSYENGQLVQYHTHAELDLVKCEEFVPRLSEDCEVGPQNQSTAHEQKENDVVAAKAKDDLYEDGPLERYNTHAELDLVTCDGSAREHCSTQSEGMSKKRAITSAEEEKKRCEEKEKRIERKKRRREKKKNSNSKPCDESLGSPNEDILKKRKRTSNSLPCNESLVRSPNEDIPKKKKRKRDNLPCNESLVRSPNEEIVKKKKKKKKRKRDVLQCNESLVRSPNEDILEKKIKRINIAEKPMHLICSTGPLEGNKGPDLEIMALGQIKDHTNNGELAHGEEMASTLSHNMIDSTNEFPENTDFQAAEPIAKPIWSGSFNILNKKHDISGLLAHLSSKACDKVYEAACQFEPALHLEMLPKSSVWPKSFETREPSGENIALYFLSSDISERDFGLLVDEMISKELALKAILQNAELLVFTSTELPLLYWRFQDKYYLWGVFRGKQIPPSIGLG